MSAYQAFITYARFQAGEFAFSFVCRELLYRRLKNIAQSPPVLNEEVAAEHIPVVFDNYVVITLLPERTNRMLAGHNVRKDTVKCPNAYLGGAVLRPPVEYPAKKISVLLRRYAKFRDSPGGRVPLHTLHKLKVLYFMLSEEIKKLIRSFHVSVAHKHQYVKFNFMPAAVLYCRRYLVKRTLTRR